MQLTLTGAGRATLERGRKLAVGVTDRLMAPLDVVEREQFQALLRKLCAGLEPQARAKLLPPGC
jgi:DNA-binding MarR family transcriptional regulator